MLAAIIVILGAAGAPLAGLMAPGNVTGKKDGKDLY
jgi:hypothetical protein